MNRFRRRVSAAVNPWSTAASRWWCRSALRHLLTGYGPTARQRRSMSRQVPGIRRAASDTGATLPAEQTAEQAEQTAEQAEQMRARAKAIDELLGRPDA
jgi:hypothetical protein